MDWVRGGHWQVVIEAPRLDVNPFDDGRRAVLTPWVGPSPGSASDGPLFEGVGDFLTPQEWWDEVGYPARLEPYDVSTTIARTILAQYTRFTDAYRTVQFAEITTVMEDQLLTLLTRFGPLSNVLGVTPPPSLFPRVIDWANRPVRTVALYSFMRELRTLALYHQVVENPPMDRHDIAAALDDYWDEIANDVAVVPTFRPNRVDYEPSPHSLRAFLMMYILGRWGRPSVRICPVCKREFQVKPGRGQPPIYCPQHRTSRDRQRISRRGAPFPEVKKLDQED